MNTFKCISRVLVLLALLYCAPEAPAGDSIASYAWAGHVGMREEGMFKVLSDTPPVLEFYVRYYLLDKTGVNEHGTPRVGVLRLSFGNGVCRAEGQGIFSPSEASETFKLGSEIWSSSPTLLSYDGGFELEEFRRIGGRILYNGYDSKFQMEIQEYDTDFKALPLTKISFESSGNGDCPLWIKALDLDGDGVMEICLGHVGESFNGFDILSKTPQHFKELDDFGEQLWLQQAYNNAEAGEKLYGKGKVKVIPLSAKKGK